jgi:DNA polymerase III sliding clamp (beta) subunit (PCNA family)
MKITIPIDNLQASLRTVRPCVSSAGTDITSHYVFRKTEDTVHVYGWSGKTFASSPVDSSSVEGSDPFTVEAKRLDLWLETLGDGVDITLDLEDFTVNAQAPRGRILFQSLDPATFPWWDTLLESADATTTVKADILHAALSHARAFVSSHEHTHPQLCVAEARDGVLYATDTMGATAIDVPGLAGSNIRIHGKDIPAAMSFLSALGGADVVLKECSKAQFFVHGAGSVFGESRPRDQFPKLTISDEEWNQSWKLDVSEIQTAMQFLSSGASWDDNRLVMERDGEGKVVLSMTSTNGKTLTQELGAVMTVSDGDEDRSDYGFSISHSHLSRLLGLHGSGSVEMLCKQHPKGGWILVREEPSSAFIKRTAISWLKPA